MTSQMLHINYLLSCPLQDGQDIADDGLNKNFFSKNILILRPFVWNPKGLIDDKSALHAVGVRLVIIQEWPGDVTSHRELDHHWFR